MSKPPKIKFLEKLFWEEISEEKRAPIPSTTKKAVYGRANGRCESRGMPLRRRITIEEVEPIGAV